MHRTLTLLATAAMSLSACSPTGGGAGGGRDAIRIVGSSTVYPMTTAVAEQFVRKNPGFKPPIVESTGTGAGAKLFCAGVGAAHPDILDASRRIKLSEFKQCAANGVSQITEIQVGLDGLSLATAKGGPLRNVSLRDIYMAIAKTPFGKPNTAKTWKDVNGSLPATPIRVYGPPTTSGTRSASPDRALAGWRFRAASTAAAQGPPVAPPAVHSRPVPWRPWP